jgi:hypothetical protein
MKRTKLGALTVIILAFILGMIVGYSATTILTDTSAEKADRSKYRNVSEYVKERLNLSEEQAVLYDEIVHLRREQMNTLHTDFRARLEEQIDSLRSEIKGILSTDQVKDYEEFLKEYKEYREGRRKR